MDLTLVRTRRETPTVTSLIFTKPPGFVYQAGQFLRWTYPVNPCDERCNSRPFSISSSPSEEYLMMTTRLGVSALKKALPNLKPGIHVKVIGPMGRFMLDETNDPLVMLVGGVGITPLRSIIKYLLDTKSTRPITLLYSNTIAEEIVFKKEFDEWSISNPTLKVIYTITKPEETTHSTSSGLMLSSVEASKIPWTGKTGRINEEMVKEYVQDLNTVHYYTSGPSIMVQAMKQLLKNLNVEEDRIQAEIFPGY